MKVILVTGLDGSGKSTLLAGLEKAAKNKSVAFLRVPKIDSHFFHEDLLLERTCNFINDMHGQADDLKVPQLKVIALFSSMVLFKQLLSVFERNNNKIVFCERHPLIDTGVYARFYADKMDPSTLSPALIDKTDRNYSMEIGYLNSLVGIKTDAGLVAYLSFIHQYFSIEKKWHLTNLQKLFDLAPPDKIFYLRASPEILMERLSNRGTLEAHESIETFRKLIPVYESVLTGSGIPTVYIDASEFSNLNKAADLMETEYLS